MKSPAFLLMCCGPIQRELVLEGLEAIDDTSEEGIFWDQNICEIVQEFLEEWVEDEDEKIARKAMEMLEKLTGIIRTESLSMNE
jgi:hypothetical protein